MSSADIYERIIRRILAHKAAFFPLDYPDAWLVPRLRRFLPRIGLLCSGNYVVRPVYRQNRVVIDYLLCFGETSRRELINIFAWMWEPVRHAGLPIRGESNDPDRYRDVGRITERELVIPLFNPGAADSWDDSSLEQKTADPRGVLARQKGALPPRAEAYTTPFYSALYLEQTSNQLVETITAFCSRHRVTFLTTDSRALTRALSAQLRASSGLEVGEPFVQYTIDIPMRRAFERYFERRQRCQLPKRILLEGKLHDLG